MQVADGCMAAGLDCSSHLPGCLVIVSQHLMAFHAQACLAAISRAGPAACSVLCDTGAYLTRKMQRP